MGLISPAQVTDGTTADASDINNPINTIANEFNGNIDNANIKAGAAISGTKLAAQTVSPTTFTNPYKFRAYKSTAQNTTTASFSKVQLDAESYDTNANYDNATNYRYTAPVAGFYFFSGTINLGATTTRIILSLYKNGTEYTRGSDTAAIATANYGVVNDLISLAASDYIELFVYTDTIKAIGTGTTPFLTYMTGYLVAPI